MSDERNEQADGHRAQMKALLGAVVEQAPEPPSVDEIQRKMGWGGEQTGSFRGSVATSRAARPEPSDVELDYVDSSVGGRGPRRSWPRLVVAAAAVVAIVAIGAALVTGRDDATEDTVAGPVVDELSAAAMSPVVAPAGHVLDWIASGVSDEGDRYAAIHYSAPTTGTLQVQSVEVDPAEVDLVAEARASGSVENWDGREVVVEGGGGTVQFVDPAGLHVLVRGDPGVVREVVHSLRVLDQDAWSDFVVQVSAEVAALPEVAGIDLVPNDEAQGQLIVPYVTTSNVAVRASVHAAVGGGAGDAGSGSGVVAGSCLTVGNVVACRPGAADFDVPGGVQTAHDVLIGGDWWHFGWSTNEIGTVSVTPVDGAEDAVGARWVHGDRGDGEPMSFYAIVLPPDVDQVEVEITDVGGGGSGGHYLRPAY